MATRVIPFLVVSFLLNYLGVPLLVSKLPKSTWQPLIDLVLDWLPLWKDRLMNRAEHLVLIKSTLAPIMVYLSIAMEISHWVHKALEKIFKAFL
jgi:hypothetical protein